MGRIPPNIVGSKSPQANRIDDVTSRKACRAPKTAQVKIEFPVDFFEELRALAKERRMSATRR
jgi:hypothetical protein